MIIPVQPNEVDNWWPHVRDFINKVPYTAQSEDDVLGELRTGANQLWVVVDGSVKLALITEVQQFPKERICVMFLAGGDGSYAQPLAETVEQWAKEFGCDAVEIYGRPGWEKVLKYKRTHVVLRKDL